MLCKWEIQNTRCSSDAPETGYKEKWCNMKNGCIICDRLFCKGKIGR